MLQGVHISDIIAGYEKAALQALDYLPGMLLPQSLMETIELVVDTVEDTHNLEKVESVLHSVVAAKQYGHENVLSKVISEACVNSLTKTASGRTDLDVDNVRVVKINGSSVDNTSYMQGMILRNAVVGSVKHVENAKV